MVLLPLIAAAGLGGGIAWLRTRTSPAGTAAPGVAPEPPSIDPGNVGQGTGEGAIAGGGWAAGPITLGDSTATGYPQVTATVEGSSYFEDRPEPTVASQDFAGGFGT